MNFKFYRVFSILASISMLYLLLFISIRVNSFHLPFYKQQFQKLQIAEKANTTNDDLMKATSVLLRYIQNEQETIDVKITRNNTLQDAFHEREIEHMKDVKHLYALLLNGSKYAISFLFCFIVYLLKKCTKEKIALFAYSFFQTSLCLFFIVVFLSMWLCIDFASLWEYLHRVFFQNLLYIMNPKTDFMILMFPEPLFFQLVFQISSCFVILFLSLWFVSYKVLKNRKYHLILLR